MTDLKDAVVLVLGLGQSGLAMARWCARFGATVRVWDSRDEPPHAAALAEHVPGAQRLRGELDEHALDGVTRVLKSPGLAPGDARIAPTLARARERAIAVQGELDLYARALAELKAERGYAPKVLAVTGTNGKTTTTALAAMLIERAGKRVVAAGNIGPTMLETLLDALELEGDARRDDEPGRDDEPSGAVEDDNAAADAVEAADGDPQQSAVEAEEVFEAEVEAELEAEEEALAGRDDAALAARDGGTESLAIEAVGDEAAAILTDAPQTTEQAAGLAAGPAATAAAAVADDEPAPILPDPEPPAPVFEHLPEVWVLELSSFQLDGAQGFEPTAATVLNITQDHLDWHGTMAAYTEAKSRIFGKTGVLVINRDEPAIEALIPPPIVVKGARGKPARTVEREVVRFGLDAPKRPGDFGLVDEGGMAWLVRARELDETLKPKATRGAKAAAAAFDPEDLHIQRLMPADALRLRGRHNASNALAALALATVAGCPLAPMLHGLREYEGEPHRVQYVATLNGVDAFDDSKGTNVGATVAAILGLGADRAPAQLVVILGGDGKGQDFAPLLAPVRRHVRAVATIGRDAAQIEDAIASSGVPIQRHATLEAATRWCYTQAHGGDAVLLSPACASLDMFRNYAHRAEVFVHEVHAMVGDAGGVV